MITAKPACSYAKGATVSAYASQWDRRDLEIRAARSQGITDLVVPALGDTGDWEELSPDPHYWVNECVAGYYGLDSIAAK